MANFQIYFEEYPEQKLIRLHYNTAYAGGSTPIKNTAELIEEINDVCGKGSYLRYSKTKLLPNGTRDYESGGNLGYAQQGFKTKVIEEAYTAAKNCMEHFNYNSITEWVEEFYDWCE